jgi:hypothetical protein
VSLLKLIKSQCVEGVSLLKLIKSQAVRGVKIKGKSETPFLQGIDFKGDFFHNTFRLIRAYIPKTTLFCFGFGG